MPKEKSSLVARMRSFVSEFGEQVFSTDGKILFCKPCGIKINCDKRFSVVQHVSTFKHNRSVKRHSDKNELSQKLITQSAPTTKKSTFNFDLCKALLSANIPLKKINNVEFKSFLEKYTDEVIPDESTLRKNYLNDCFEETLTKIKSTFQDKKIWISIDETTDIEGRYVANVIIGSLNVDKPGQIALLNCEVLDKANYFTISKLFDKTLHLLWPDGIKHENVLLFVSDAAPYMVKAGGAIKAFYDKMIHVTCLAHALHRVAEEVRRLFPSVDKLISSIKKVFLKCPSRIEIFRKVLPNINLPPQPIITRWGTWINAAIYYCENIQKIRNVIEQFDTDDAVSILQAKEVLSEKSLDSSLIYIKSNFKILATAIENLEKSGMTLFDAINIVKNVEQSLKSNQNDKGIAVFKKFQKVIQNNKGFGILCTISNILNGEDNTIKTEENLTPDDLTYFKYAPITSVDVERSFSKYKQFLTDRRRSMHFENISKTIIIQCNTHLSK